MKLKSENSEGKRVGIWIRVSTEQQAKGDSPEHHEIRARQYADMKGWNVVEVYDLSGISGKTVVEESESRRMLRDVQRGHITGLIFSKLERLARNTRELLDLPNFFQKHDADMISLEDSIDTTTAMGRYFYTLTAAQAQLGRELTVERVKASVSIRAKLGKHMGGKAPYGYKWVDKKLVPNPETAPVRKLIHELYLKHGRKNAVARILNDAGHRTQFGKSFTAAGIRILLHDSTPKGLHKANYMTSSRIKGMRYKAEDQWVYHEVEPILSAELWDSCYQILLAQEAAEKPRARTPVHIFSGIAICGKCGSKMYVVTKNPKYVCRNKDCRQKISCEDLEAVFIDELRNYFISPDRMERYLVEAHTEVQQKESLLANLVRERAKVRLEMDRFCQLIKDDAISVEGFKEHYRPMEERYAQLSAEIPRLEGDLDYMKVNLLSGDEVFRTGQNMAEVWPTLDQQEKQRVAELWAEQIVVHLNTIEIHIYHEPEKMKRYLDQENGNNGESGSDLAPGAVLSSSGNPASPYPSIAHALSEDVVTSATALKGP